jgi:hypothetical protein
VGATGSGKITQHYFNLRSHFTRGNRSVDEDRPDAPLSLREASGLCENQARSVFPAVFTIEGAHVLNVYKKVHGSRMVVAAALLGLAGCGSGSKPGDSGSFSGAVAAPSDQVTVPITSRAGVAAVTLSRAHSMGGTSAEITVSLTRPAPGDGVDVQLKSSDASIAAIPARVRIPSGQTSVTVAASTLPVTTASTVGISAFYGNAVVGTSLRVDPATTAPFTIALHPSTVKIAPGQSGSTTVKTKVSRGYDHALQLTVSNVPTGVSVTFTPPVIPAPGTGTSVANITVPDSMVTGTYSMEVTASDGSTTRSANLNLKVAASGPGATFQGCWYKHNGSRYQGVDISVAKPGTYPFDAVLYYGTTCNPNDWADEIGFGELLQFGDWIFWFSAFPNQTDMSAYWYVGDNQSQCVNYAVAPDC